MWRPGERIEFSVIFEDSPHIFHYNSHDPSSEHDRIYETPADCELCTSLAWSEAGQLAAGFSNGIICIWYEGASAPGLIFTPESIELHNYNQAIGCLAWNEVEGYSALVSGSKAGVVSVWSVKLGQGVS